MEYPGGSYEIGICIVVGAIQEAPDEHKVEDVESICKERFVIRFWLILNFSKY